MEAHPGYVAAGLQPGHPTGNPGLKCKPRLPGGSPGLSVRGSGPSRPAGRVRSTIRAL